MLDRHQRETILGDRLAQLVELHARFLELVEQVLACFALFPLESLEEALGLPVHQSPWRSRSRKSSSVTSAGSVVSMKSESVLTKRRGSSRCGKCPASGKTSKRRAGRTLRAPPPGCPRAILSAPPPR